MGIFGDTAYDLLGFTDPRKKLAAAMNPNPLAGANAKPPPSQFQPTMAMGGEGPDQQQPPAPPPQPQAYTSGPDFSKMYLDMLNRQEGSDAIDRGMGLLFAGFAHPNDRAGMVNAMSSSSSRDPGSMIAEMQTAQLQQGKIDSRAQLLQHAPELAQQLGMPLAQVIASINSGAMDDIIKEHDRATILQGSPLYHAQTESAATEAALHRNQAELERAKITLANATLPSDIAKAKEEVTKLQLESEKIRAETGAVPSLIEQRQAETEKTKAETGAVPSLIEQRQAEADKSKAETEAIPDKRALEQAQAKAADAAALKAATTPQQQNYDRYSKDEIAAGRAPIGFLDFLKTGGGGSAREKMGLQINWRIKSENGQPVLDENGKPVMEGFRIGDVRGAEPEVVPGAIIKAQRTDTGTGWTYINPFTGQPIGAPISKNVEEVAAERAKGEATAKAKAEASTALGAKLTAIGDNIKVVQDALDDPNLGSMLGARNPKRALGTAFRSDEDNVTQSRIDQAGAINTAQIASTLHSAGISRVAVQEVMAAADSVNRLKRTELSEKDYRIAGREAIDRLKRAMAVAYDEAGADRPAELKDIDLKAISGSKKKGHWDKEKGKIVYD